MQTLLINTSIPSRPLDIGNRRKNIISQAIDVLGRDGAHDLFHNHKGQKALHRYPLIQYRVSNNMLTLFAIGEAVPALIKVVVDADLDNRSHRITLNNVTMQKGKAELTPSKRNEYYRLMDWVAFNNEVFNEKWNTSYSFLERVGLLNDAISGHLRVLGYQLLPQEDVQKIEGELYMLTNRKTQDLYGNKVMGFNVIFKTPYHLPENFALGRGISLGTGTFQKLRNNPEVNSKTAKVGNQKNSNVIKEREENVLDV